MLLNYTGKTVGGGRCMGTGLRALWRCSVAWIHCGPGMSFLMSLALLLLSLITHPFDMHFTPGYLHSTLTAWVSPGGSVLKLGFYSASIHPHCISELQISTGVANLLSPQDLQASGSNLPLEVHLWAAHYLCYHQWAQEWPWRPPFLKSKPFLQPVWPKVSFCSLITC